MLDTVKLLYSVGKLRIGFAIALSALAGLVVTPGAGPEGWQIAVLALTVLFASSAAGAFNHYVERESDARMARTRSRPFVTGRFRAGAGWPIGIAIVLIFAVAAAAAVVNVMSALYVFLGAFFYGIVYTVWLKRRTWLNIVIGGLAGSFAVLAGAAAVDPGLAPAPVILAVVMFLWTPPHFWSLAWVYREDYARAGVPMLPVVVDAATTARVIFAHTVLLVALSFVPLAYGLGWVYGLGAAIGGAYFVRTSARLVRTPTVVSARANFNASLVQLSLLLVATFADAIWRGLAA